MSGKGNGRLGATEYAELIGRVRETVAATVPPGASVLVVSKGDAALLELPGLSTAHFPQGDAGGYAGHHPRDGATATGELEALRRQGAEYLVIPATARWWLDFYDELAAHLAAHGELLADAADACLVYGLGRRPESAAVIATSSRPRAGADQVRDYLENLVPADCELVVLEAEAGLAAALSPLRAAGLPAEAGPGRGGDLLSHLGALAADGARYLVVPRSCDRWLARQAGLEEQLERRHRKVADQRHLCRVFEIERSPEVR